MLLGYDGEDPEIREWKEDGKGRFDCEWRQGILAKNRVSQSWIGMDGYRQLTSELMNGTIFFPLMMTLSHQRRAASSQPFQSAGGLPFISSYSVENSIERHEWKQGLT